MPEQCCPCQEGLGSTNQSQWTQRIIGRINYTLSHEASNDLVGHAEGKGEEEDTLQSEMKLGMEAYQQQKRIEEVDGGGRCSAKIL